jgi:tetratricopeptide (TPR) repeat protein
MRIMLGILGVCLAAQAWAGDAMQRARQAYDDMEFDAALRAVDQALGDPQAQPPDLVDAYRVRGLSLSALERLDEALEAFRAMLSIDPKAAIAADTSPKLAAPFFQALAMSRDVKPIALTHAAPPATGRPAALGVELRSDPQGLVKGVRLVHRGPGGGWQRTPAQALAGAPRASFPPPTGEAVEYFFEALTGQGGVLARVGGPDKPFAFRAPAAVAAGPRAAKPPEKPLEKPVNGPAEQKDPPRAVAGLGEGGRGGEDEEDVAAPWYETWWFWTAVGVVVVGTALGAGLGVGLSGDGSGPRDYSIEVR